MHPWIRTRLLLGHLLLASATALALGCPLPVTPTTPPAEGSVAIAMPEQPVYVGSYHYVPLRIDPASGVTLDDLELEITSGLAGGMFSRSKDATQSPKEPTLMFGAGYQPGVHEVVVKHRPSGTVLTTAKLEVTDVWTDDAEGPSFWFSGKTEGGTVGSAWGGGPAGVQNASTIPASGTRRLALVLIDTSGTRYTTDATALQTIRDRWEDEVEDGVTAGGVTRSANAYYQEVSYGNLSLTADVLGPVQLPNDWTTYYDVVGTNGHSDPKGSFWQSAITAADSVVDYRNYDMIVFVMQEDTAATPSRFSWAWGGSGTYTTAEGTVTKGVIVMPQFWGSADFQAKRPGDTRQIHQTVSHELGHTLGMGDLYTPGVAGRNVGGWDIMDSEGPLPNLSIAHRLALGWVQPGWVRAFDFATMGAPVDQTVRLQAIETGAPAAGRSSGVEIRIADGWNYYLEYRNGQAGQISDQSLPTPSRVLGTDVVSGSFTAPIARPGILLLNADADGDGPVLGNGQDYEERDLTDPVYPTDFRIDVSGVDGTKADVRIRYGVNSRPDPSIRPWPASAERQWQSPDIEVRNARNQADPSWFNVPWEGNPNTVVAKIKNNGNLDAPGVRVDFYVKDYTVGNAPETFIGTQTQDIGAGTTLEFTTSWTPPAQGHYCIIVRIPLYLVPGASPAVPEMTELNNVAQSNYDRFISRTASPSSRERTKVTVTNPYDETAIVYLQPRQSNPLYRTYVEHTWVRLGPKESREVAVMFEFAGDDFLAGKLSPADDQRNAKKTYEKLRRVPNDFGLRAMVGDPRTRDLHYMDVVGGVDAEVVEGKASRFTRLRADRNDKGTFVEGAVRTKREAAPDGTVILTFTIKGDETINATLPLVRGEVSGTVKVPEWETMRAYYLPPPGTADATSPTLVPGETLELEPTDDPRQ